MGIGGNWDRRLFSRRRFLGTAGGLAGLLALASPPTERAVTAPRFSDYPFKLGVASGDPRPDSVVLWTRLAPEPLAEDGSGGVPPERYGVRWEVAADESFRRVVRRGSAVAGAGLGHSVHAGVGGLRPGREYFYRFKVGGEISAVGRTKTAPPFDARLASLALAFVSCQDWRDGFYAAYKRLAEEDLDFVVHLGDYIYEGGNTDEGVRDHTDGGREVFTLAEYRNRHALYKTDESLQAAHAAFPWMVTWDDHEVDNDYADEAQDGGQDPEAFLRRRAAAYRAYYEHMPLRRTSLPQGPDMRLYRRLSWGDLVGISLLDTRQCRSDQPGRTSDIDGLAERCAEALSESQTMMGPRQERWLKEGLARSRKGWNVTAQQTMLAEYDFSAVPDGQPNGQLFNMDQWDGYVAARRRLIGILDRAKVRNPITLTGDIHSSWVHDLKTDFDEPASRTVGTEFVGTSISSPFETAFSGPVEAARADNPHCKYVDGTYRGYARCDVTPDLWLTTFKGVVTAPPNGNVVDPNAPSYTAAAFAVESGAPGAQRV